MWAMARIHLKVVDAQGGARHEGDLEAVERHQVGVPKEVLRQPHDLAVVEHPRLHEVQGEATLHEQ